MTLAGTMVVGSLAPMVPPNPWAPQLDAIAWPDAVWITVDAFRFWRRCYGDDA